LPEDLAGPADLPRFGVLEHEHEQVAGLAVFLPGEALVPPRGLLARGRRVGGEGGGAAAGQLGHLVDRAKVLAGRRADAIAHLPLPASRRIVSADKAARSARLSTIRNSSML